MTDKEVRKLSRAELLEMLIAQSNLVESLQKQLEEANQKLASRQILLQDSGSIAEASLKLSGIFEAAQNAADQYLENVSQVQEKCDAMERAAREEAERILSDAQKTSEEMVRAAEQESRKWWERTSRDLEAFYDAHQGLRDLIEMTAQRYQKNRENA